MNRLAEAGIMADSLQDLSQAMLDAARKAGADSADAIAVSGRSLSIEVLHGTLEHAERAEGVDIGLRVMIGQRQACVSSSDINPETIAEMAERAVAMARKASRINHLGLRVQASEGGPPPLGRRCAGHRCEAVHDFP